MTPASAGSHGSLEAALWEAAGKASRLMEPKSLGVLCRKPLLDEDCPEVSDVDLLSIWEEPEEHPERMTIESPAGRVFVDVLWVPASKMFDPIEAASYKILPHLLLESETVWMRSDSVQPFVENIKHSMYEKTIWGRRIGHQLNFGDAALQEASKNLDFPPAALFFLQTAHSYYAMALADCLKQSTMALLTRPITKLKRMAAETGCELGSLLVANLHLETEPVASLGALDRVYAAVSARCSARQPEGVKGRASGHYAYSLSPLELEYRKMVAGALVSRGDFANANFYIRFWAYSLSRCPVILEDARQGRNPSFYVPFGGFKESLQAACPEIIDDMELILGGRMTEEEAKESIDGTVSFRRMVEDQIQARGISLTSPRDAGAEGA
ncbi:MAG: hypothetical protein OK455_03215 [Thaumarchaeota archaeon]|nr:hypothetical protein [Nitrososphaerota archaeon]